MFEVGDERGDGLVDAAHEVAVRSFDVVVAVPGAVVELHEPGAFLDEFAGEQTLAAKAVGLGLADAVGLLGLLALGRDVHRLGHLHLHAEGEFIVVHPRPEFVEIFMIGRVTGVEFRDEIEVLALAFLADPGRGIEIEDGRTFGA